MLQEYLLRHQEHMDMERLIGHLLGPEYDHFNSELKSEYARSYGLYKLARARAVEEGLLPNEPQFDNCNDVDRSSIFLICYLLRI